MVAAHILVIGATGEYPVFSYIRIHDTIIIVL